MAIVYRAYDERLGRSVALKVLTPRLALDTAFRHRFIRESRIAASVDHPNIIPIFAAGEADGFLFIAMRFVQGRDVLTVLEEEGPLPAARACNIVTQVAAALDAAHDRGLVHRDVKPANMLREAAGEDQPDHVYLSDFGLSKHWLSSSTLTSQGEFLGTMDYVAPEQIEGNPVDGRSDQYALACSTFEMLSGAPPFRRNEAMAIMWAQVSAVPPTLTSRRPDLPAAVDPVLAKALAKAPDDRYRTCLEFAAALRSAIESPVTEPPPDRSPPGPPPAAAVLGSVPPGSAVPGSAPPGSGLPGSVPPAGAVLGSVPPGRPRSGSEPGGPAGDDTQRVGEPVAMPPAAGAGVPRGGAPVEPAAPGGPVEPGGLGAPGAGAALDVPGGRPAPPGPAAYRLPPGRPPPRSRRSRAAILVACVALLGAIGAGYALFGRGAGTRPGAGLAAPGCTTRTARATSLAKVHGHRATIGGQPLDVVVTSHGYGFVSLGTALGVLRTTGTVPVLVRTVALSAPLGLALTHDQKYLLVADHGGLTVFRVSDLENGLSAPLGTLASPGGSHAVQVAVSPDDKFAFATLQSGQPGGDVAVYSLHRALASTFSRANRVRLIPVAARPAGVAISPDGLYAYVASGLATPASASGQGRLTVISMLKEGNTPAFSVVKTVAAGCGPDQVAISKDSQDVWVTVTGANAVVAYSAARLLSDPQHALVARVAVGSQPLGMVFYDHGLRLIVADGGRQQAAGGAAIVDVPRALAVRPALLGTVPTGPGPQQVALYPGGKTLLLADAGSRQLHVIRVAQLP
jgi:serine/threonine-protein kinase